MKTGYKKIFKYTFITLLFFISLVVIFSAFRGDSYVNYGFSYAITKGEIPYNDYNLVISPLAPYLYSIGLFIFNDFIMYYLEQAILLTVMFYYLEKLLPKKHNIYIALMLMSFPLSLVSTIFPGYNFLIILFYIMFIYYFRKKNYYISGILLGLILCTKQTIGLIIYLPTLYYLFKDRKIFKEITLGYLIPTSILLIYLLLTRSGNNYINLCFLGLFDFGNNNSSIDTFYIYFLIIGIIYLIYLIIKKKDNYILIYSLFFSVVSLPIIDYYHVSQFLVIVLFHFIDLTKIDKKYFKYIYEIIIIITIMYSVKAIEFCKPISIANFNHFSWVINDKNSINKTKNLLKYTKSLDKKVIYLMRGSENYFYKIIEDKKIDYYDLTNYGNYGYHGTEKMLKKLEKEHDVYIVIDPKVTFNADYFQQYVKELGQYVIKESDLVKEIDIYQIYYKK